MPGGSRDGVRVSSGARARISGVELFRRLEQGAEN